MLQLSYDSLNFKPLDQPAQDRRM